MVYDGRKTGIERKINVKITFSTYTFYRCTYFLICVTYNQQSYILVAASCYGNVFCQEGQGRWSVDGEFDKYIVPAKDMRLELKFTFQQDNDPKHTARATIDRSKYIHLLVMNVETRRVLVSIISE
ncbi:hypothetical protein AMECASPLE_012258 [Ameca splendens]|uniref:Uncharacterized protein n=1 Tax=Ameca splendens TaxID=208324 RepID=A0ABV0Y146_9TELE